MTSDKLRALRSKAIHTAEEVLPRGLWNALLRFRGHEVRPREPWRDLIYQGVKTSHNARPLHVGPFADLFNKWVSVDPYASDVMRYRAYNVTELAYQARHVAGDLLCVGVSYGVLPRILYDRLEIGSSSKTLHLVDAFTGSIDSVAAHTRPYYNSDPDLVAAQYPEGARVKIHRGFAPQAIEPIAGPFSFVSFNTGDAKAEIASLPLAFDRLAPGGIIMCELIGIRDGRYEEFEPVFKAMGVEPFWFLSGQCAIFKPPLAVK